MFSRYQLTTVLSAALAFVAVAAISGCVDQQYITVDSPDNRRNVGEACVLDDQCEGGRCIAGKCDDGSCTGDGDCTADEICVFGACEPADDFACTPEQQPLLSIDALAVDFGEVALGNTGEQILQIGNSGDCLLTISGIGLESNADPGFACDPCDVSLFPQRVPPQRVLDVTVSFTPPAPGEASSRMLIRSDDETAGDEGLLAVDLHASYSGIPVLTLEPNELSFGYVPWVAGGVQSEATESIRVMNQGTGNATLTVQFIYVQPGTDFSIPAEFAAVAPSAPRLLPPYNPNDPNTWIDIPVTFRPTRNANQETTLTVNAHSGDPASAINVAARLVASSKGPPQIDVSATELVYQQDDGEAYPLGMVAFRQVTISNSGQSELAVNMSLTDPSGDFTISPPFVPPVAPGGAVVVSVFFNPSAPSDPTSVNDPQVPFNAALNITSDDTDPATDVLKIVALRGWAKGGTFDDLLKLEMTYENADNGWAGSDFRDVDLELVSPLGLSCAKPRINYAETPPGSGNWIPSLAQDFCGQFNSVDSDNDDRPDNGTASWIALGQYEEPERILLFGLGQDLANGQIYEVRAHYIEDCANIPTGIFSDILGIGVSVLLGVLGGSVGVPIAVPPDQVSEIISSNCWDHASSLVTLHISINGEEIAAPQMRLQERGDSATLVRLKRQDGQFTIVP